MYPWLVEELVTGAGADVVAVAGTDGLDALLAARMLMESGAEDLDVVVAVEDGVTTAGLLVTAAVPALLGTAGRGFLGTVTEYISSRFFFFSSVTISDKRPSELLVVVLPVSSFLRSGPVASSSSMLA